MGDKAREEFFSEAHEIIEGLSRDLLQLDSSRGKGPVDPELVNNIFRAVHTLKGLAGLFGAARMSALSHELENVLDDLRLGKIELTQAALDLLFRGVTIYGRILAVEKGTRTDPLDRHRRVLARARRPVGVAVGRGAHLRRVLRARSRACSPCSPSTKSIAFARISSRGRVFFDCACGSSSPPSTPRLTTLKTKAKPHGEIITYLPTGEGAEADSIELDILMASQGQPRRSSLAPRRRAGAHRRGPAAVAGRQGSGARAVPRRQPRALAGPRGFVSAHPASAPPRPKAVAQRPGALPKSGSPARRHGARSRCDRSRRRCASTSASSTS